MSLFAGCIDYVTALIINSAHYISQIAHARADIYPHWVIPVLGVGVIVSVVYYLKSRSTRSFIIASGLGSLLCIAALIFPSAMPPDRLSIPANYQAMQVFYTQSGHQHTHTFREGETSGLRLTRGTIMYADSPVELPAPYGSNADILIIGHNISGDIDALISMCSPKLIVLSARADDRLAAKVQNIAYSCGVHLHSLRDDDIKFVYDR